ncbi:hypothetical protein [Roseomonas indoligenes]|uniref:DUF2939 domain-containing protein n=1 Tax=Roseomonas indoligenes TaxID=2820811 RepID=A0A940N390_9PROT|nr:hypothetical protein [Pararoseomonas indoligenes]MBP0493402.1 hypothetical protein [Pararoseomonas indoligenes]
MQADQRAAIWEEVWAEYDARQAERTLEAPRAVRGGAVPRPGTKATGVDARGWPRPWEAEQARKVRPRIRLRPLMQVGLAAMAAAMLLAGWLVLPWLLGVRLSLPIGQGDAPGLLRQVDAPSTLASLRAGLAAEVPEDETGGARRYLSALADRMAESWARPEGMSAWLGARRRGGREDGPAVALSSLRSARAVGLASFRLEYGPRNEDGGVAFEMAWQGEGFRVTGVTFLNAPSAARAVAGPVVAMR